MSEWLPAPDSARIRDTHVEDVDVVALEIGHRLLRVHPLAGPHPVAWNAFRAWGPTAGRFDHQPPPRRTHRTRQIAYFTHGPEAFNTALAEFFQDDNGGVGPVDLVRRSPHMSALEMVAPLRLLDLSSGWVTRAGGNQAINSGSRQRSQEWARAIYQHHRRVIDGVAYPSSVWGPGKCVALWENAKKAMPDAPVVHRSLNDAALVDAMASAVEAMGTYTV